MTDPHATEHDLAPPDFADSYALLDDGQVIASVESLWDDGDNDILNAARRRYRGSPTWRRDTTKK